MNNIDKPNPLDAYLRRKELGITWQQEKAIEMGYTDLETVLKENKASEKNDDEYIICKKCNQKTPVESRFCLECGEKIK